MTATYLKPGTSRSLLQRVIHKYRQANKARRERQWAHRLSMQEELRAEERVYVRRRHLWD